jgi:hypothetical protein
MPNSEPIHDAHVHFRQPESTEEVQTSKRNVRSACGDSEQTKKIHGASYQGRNRGIAMCGVHHHQPQSSCLHVQKNVAESFYMHGEVSAARLVCSV